MYLAQRCTCSFLVKWDWFSEEEEKGKTWWVVQVYHVYKMPKGEPPPMTMEGR